jgi:guanylate kinase
MELTERLKQKVAHYKVPPHALDPIRYAPLLFAVGISGTGKNTILDYLLKKYPDRYQFIVSHTTRPMRDYETADVQYHFIDFPAAEEMLDNGRFIEAQIVHFDNIYGTAIEEIERAQQANKIACTDIEIQGVDEYMALGLNAKAVFLLPPHYAVWKQRLLSRPGELTAKDMRNRIKSALVEIEHAMGLQHYYIVINNELTETAELVHKIATGDEVEPHYHKAMAIAEHMLEELRAELVKLQ